MRLEKSKDKLEEARFFLAHLREVPNDSRKPINRRAPHYYFSAFLNAGYSTIQFVWRELKKELRQQNLSKSKIEQQYREWRKQWDDALSDDDERFCWYALTQMAGLRGKEIHEQRTKTVFREKTIVIESFPNDFNSEQKREYEAYYLMRQQVAPFYPEVQPTNHELSRSRFTVTTEITLSIQEHYAEVAGSLEPIVGICAKQVALLEKFINYIEQLVP